MLPTSASTSLCQLCFHLAEGSSESRPERLTVSVRKRHRSREDFCGHLLMVNWTSYEPKQWIIDIDLSKNEELIWRIEVPLTEMAIEIWESRETQNRPILWKWNDLRTQFGTNPGRFVVPSDLVRLSKPTDATRLGGGMVGLDSLCCTAVPF